MADGTTSCEETEFSTNQYRQMHIFQDGGHLGRQKFEKNVSQFFCHTQKNGCVQSYYVKDIVSKYVEIHNNWIISKIMANMAAKNLNLVYICSAIRCKEE